MLKDRTFDMTEGSPTGGIVRFALPLVMGYILQQMYLVVDAAIVGRWLGVESLAAVGASTSVMFLIMGFCNGVCAGFSIPVAQWFGGRDYGLMRRYVAKALRGWAVLAVLLTLLGSLFCGGILRLVNTPSVVFGDAWMFLLFQLLAIPLTMGYALLSCFIRALGNSRQGFHFLIAASLLNVVLDVTLIVVEALLLSPPKGGGWLREEGHLWQW